MYVIGRLYEGHTGPVEIAPDIHADVISVDNNLHSGGIWLGNVVAMLVIGCKAVEIMSSGVPGPTDVVKPMTPETFEYDGVIYRIIGTGYGQDEGGVYLKYRVFG